MNITLQEILPVLSAVSAIRHSLPRFLDGAVESTDPYINYVGPSALFMAKIGHMPGGFLDAMTINGNAIEFNTPNGGKHELDARLFTDFHSMTEEEADNILSSFLGIPDLHLNRHSDVFEEEMEKLSSIVKTLLESPFTAKVLGAKNVTEEVNTLMEREQALLNEVIDRMVAERDSTKLFRVSGLPILSTSYYPTGESTIYHQLPDGQIFYARSDQDETTWNLVEASL